MGPAAKSKRSVKPVILHAMAKRIAYNDQWPSDLDDDVENMWDVAHYPNKAHPLPEHSRKHTRANTLNFSTFVPRKSESHLAPVIAFGGSKQIGDWLTDFDTRGPGYTQYRMNRIYIQQIVEKMAEDWGKVLGRVMPKEELFRDLVFTGHSLGGALAQMAALSLFPECHRVCAQVVTFQTLGIGKLRHYGLVFTPKGHPPSPDSRHVARAKPTTTHWMAYGGIVSAVGANLLPGQFNVVAIDDTYGYHDVVMRKTDAVHLHTMDLIPAADSRRKGTATQDPYPYRKSSEKLRKQAGLIVRAVYRKYRVTPRGKTHANYVAAIALKVAAKTPEQLFEELKGVLTELARLFTVATAFVKELDGPPAGWSSPPLRKSHPVARLRRTVQRTVLEVYCAVANFELMGVRVLRPAVAGFHATMQGYYSELVTAKPPLLAGPALVPQ